jgi:hypothetical protein
MSFGMPLNLRTPGDNNGNNHLAAGAGHASIVRQAGGFVKCHFFDTHNVRG